MPGATLEAPVEPEAAAATKTETPKAEKSAETGLSAEDTAELARLRAVHKDEQKWEKRAKQDLADAERWRQLHQQVGGESKEFDPQAEFQTLRNEIERERTERLRSEVARTEEVDPDFVIGATEEQMRESAQRYKAKVEAAIEKALKGRASSAVPASEVTSNGKVAGPGQIKSQDELKTMSPQEILAAKNEGRLDHLMGKN